MRIEVSSHVKMEMDRLCRIFGHTEDTLLRKLLRLPEPGGTSIERQAMPVPGEANGLISRDGVALPIGMKLRKQLKGRLWQGVVEPGGIVVDGVDGKFTSPSLAGVAITGYAVNGWRFWEYFDKKTETWRSLDDLRANKGR